MGNGVFGQCPSLSSVTLCGDMPDITWNGFTGTTAVIHYPAGNETYTDYLMDNYAGTLTWKGDRYTVSVSAVNGSAEASYECAASGTLIRIRNLTPGGNCILRSITWKTEGGTETDITETKSFTLPAAHVTVKVTFLKMQFTDVRDPSAYFFEPVYWAKSKGITTGTTSTTFSPYKTCTRGQIITFIWRVMGSPEPESYKNPFKDVDSTDYFYKPVLWSYYKGINYGKTPTTFGPYLSCTREQAMTFLYRAAGKPGVTVGTRFKDVKTGQFYTDAVYWALDKGITTGQTETTFGVGKPCTRGQIITFLYRYAGLTGRL